jgi:hypothetical protein
VLGPFFVRADGPTASPSGPHRLPAIATLFGAPRRLVAFRTPGDNIAFTDRDQKPVLALQRASAWIGARSVVDRRALPALNDTSYEPNVTLGLNLTPESWLNCCTSAISPL